MVAPLVGAAAIMGGSQIASSFLGGSDGPDYGKQLENWLIQQEYNTPANQVARLRAAGLNPNLIYGNGSAATGNASSGPYHDVGERQGHHHNFVQALNAVSSAVGTYLDLKGKAQQQDLEKVKVLSDIEHSKDALEFEKRRFMVDQAFRDTELRLREKELGLRTSWKDREYQLSKEKLDFERSKPYGGAVGFMDKLIHGVTGQSTSDVAGDVGSGLQNVLFNAFDNMLNYNWKKGAVGNAVTWALRKASGL